MLEQIEPPKPRQMDDENLFYDDGNELTTAHS